jgi:VIT1/CCC1 family predicted Fe2+/Mn2+ transporter
MPLSEHEQRLLDQIERALYAEDPKFASTVRGAKLRRPSRRRRFQGIALFAVGVAALVIGVVFSQLALAGIPVVSVVGFLFMFFGVLVTLTTLRRGDQAAEEVDEEGNRPGRSRSSFSQKMEERFRRRFEDE